MGSVISISFSKLQKEYFKNAVHRWNFKVGATRSGKTYMDYFLIPKRIFKTKEEGLIVLIGYTRGTIERNIIEPMRKIYGSTLVGKISQNGTIELFGKKCFIFGADRANAVSKIQGTSIEYCYGDEVATWCEDVFNMLKSRLDKPNSIFDGTLNPDSPNHWLKKFLDSDADIFAQHYTIFDNPYLTPEFVENLQKEYQGTAYYDRFILGKWAASGGLVYPMFSEKTHISGCGAGDEFYVSIDYGTLNPCSMGLWQYDRKSGTAFRVREFYHDGRKLQRQMTDEEYYDELLKLVGEEKICAVIIDPSAASFIATIRKHGRFRVRKADNRVLDGIRLVCELLNSKRILFSPCCSNTFDEFNSYKWDETSQEDRVIKQNDHAMDEIRYFASTVMRR